MLDSLKVAYRKDPALHGVHALEVVLYQSIWAIGSYRIAHALWKAHVPLVPRLISQVARLCTGIAIHPGTVIGKRCFIGHGTGVVIGETAVIGDDVMMYHGVTIGGHGWWVDAKGAKRHPTIGNNVALDVGCSVLGPVVVGDHCRIGPHALVVDDVPAGSVVVVARGHCVTLTRGREEEAADEERLPTAWMTSEAEETLDGRA